jgi:hypothetical protein
MTQDRGYRNAQARTTAQDDTARDGTKVLFPLHLHLIAMILRQTSPWPQDAAMQKANAAAGDRVSGH